MRKIFFISIFALIFIIFLFFLFGLFFWREIYLPKDFNLKESKIFSVEKGENVFQMAENLEREGLIKNRYFFVLYTLKQGKTRNLQAGDYELSPAMNIAEIAQKIISGDIAKEKITIIEGWNLKDIGFYFERKGMFQAEELYDERADLEGYFFPDTYEIRKGESLEEIINKAVENFNKKLSPELREEIKRQEKTISEIVTMASLIEKEVKTKEDKELVSGILWKRLKNGIPLQVDATITYITGKKTTKISIEETQIDNPYNTYKYKGLPPGPICNPGLESIMAAIYPQESEYWYYLSTPAGKTIFSKTLKEHNLAKRKFLE